MSVHLRDTCELFKGALNSVVVMETGLFSTPPSPGSIFLEVFGVRNLPIQIGVWGTIAISP